MKTITYGYAISRVPFSLANTPINSLGGSSTITMNTSVVSQNDLLTEVETIAADQPALVFSKEGFRFLILQSFVEFANRVNKLTSELEAYPDISITYSALKLPTGSEFDVDIDQDPTSGETYIEISPSFTFDLQVHTTTNKKLFSTIRVPINGIRTVLNINAPHLTFDDYEINIGEVKIFEDNDRQDAINQIGIKEEILYRIEGALAYLMPERVVKAALVDTPDINLEDHFTSMNIKGTLDMHVSQNALIIIPSGGMEMNGHLECRIGDNNIPQVNTVYNPTRLPDGNMDVDVTVPNPGSITRPQYSNSPGLISLYMTQNMWDDLCGAMKFNFQDRANSGKYRYAFNMDFACSNLDFNAPPPNIGGIATLDFSATGTVDVYMKIPCKGRKKVASSKITSNVSQLDLYMLFVDSSNNGEIGFKSELKTFNPLSINVRTSPKLGWLGLLGITGLVIKQMVGDFVDRKLRKKLKSKINSAIRSALSKHSYILIDIGSLTDLSTRYPYFVVSYANNANAVLVGVSPYGDDGDEG